jgi:hypothetical protein
MSRIYRFTQPIRLSDGTIIGNADKAAGPLGGECFLDKDEDNETQRLVKAQCEKEQAEADKAEAKKKKTETSAK